MRETSVLYQQMLWACISAPENEDPRLPPPSLATRRHVCVHVVYLARSELCEMGDGRDGRALGGLPVLSAGSNNQPLSVTQGVQVCEKWRSPSIGLTFSHTSRLGSTVIVGNLRIRKFTISCNWILWCDPLAFNGIRGLSLFLTNDEFACWCYARRLAIIRSESYNWNVTSRFRQFFVIKEVLCMNAYWIYPLIFEDKHYCEHLHSSRKPVLL